MAERKVTDGKAADDGAGITAQWAGAERTTVLIPAVYAVLENPKGVSEMCKVIEDMRKEEREESMRTVALRMLADGTLALEKIAEYVGLSLDEVKKLQAGQNA